MKNIYRRCFALVIPIVLLAPQAANTQAPSNVDEPTYKFCQGWPEYRDRRFFDDYVRVVNSANRFAKAREDAQQILDEMNNWSDGGLYSVEFLGSGAGEAWLQSLNFIKLAADGIGDALGIATAGASTTAREAVLQHINRGIGVGSGLASSGEEVTFFKVGLARIPILGQTMAAVLNAIENAYQFKATDDDIKRLRTIIEVNTNRLMGQIKQAEAEYERRILQMEGLNEIKNAADGICNSINISEADPLVGTWFCQGSFRMAWGQAFGNSIANYTLNPDGTYSGTYSSDIEVFPNKGEVGNLRSSGTFYNVIRKGNRVISTSGNETRNDQLSTDAIVILQDVQWRSVSEISGETMRMIEYSTTNDEYISGESSCQKQ